MRQPAKVRGGRRNGAARSGAPTPNPGPSGLPARSLLRREGPLYRQLAILLRQPILDGGLAPGTELPREADLAERYGISLITVRHALRELEAEGLIKKRPAKPAVVASPESRRILNVAYKSLTEIAASATTRRLEIHSYQRERSAVATKAFKLGPDEVAHCLRATQFSKDLPASYITIYFPPVVGERMKRADFDDAVVFRAVQRHLGIAMSGARITVRADTADATLSRALKYEAGGAVLVVEMLFFSADGEPVELTIARNRADLFSLSYDAPNDLI